MLTSKRLLKTLITPHLKKLSKCGIRRVALKWVSSYSTFYSCGEAIIQVPNVVKQNIKGRIMWFDVRQILLLTEGETLQFVGLDTNKVRETKFWVFVWMTI